MNKDELASRGEYWLERFWNERSVMERVIRAEGLTDAVTLSQETIRKVARQIAEDCFTEDMQILRDMKEILDGSAENEFFKSVDSIKEVIAPYPWILENRDPTAEEAFDFKRLSAGHWLMNEANEYVIYKFEECDDIEELSKENPIRRFLATVPKKQWPLAELVALHVVYSMLADEFKKLEAIEQYLANVAQPMIIGFPDLYYKHLDGHPVDESDLIPWWKRKGPGRKPLEQLSKLDAVCSLAWERECTKKAGISISDPKTSFYTEIWAIAKAPPFNLSLSWDQASEWGRRWLKLYKDKK